MRHFFLPFLLTVLLCSSCATGSDKISGDAGTVDLWESGTALAIYGFITGSLLGLLLRGPRKSGGLSRNKHSAAGNSTGHDTGSDLEQQYYNLEMKFRSLQEEHKELGRQLAETKQFLAADRMKKTPQAEETVVDLPDREGDAEMLVLYFLQPARDGKFRDSGKVSGAAEALYALTIRPDNPEEALLQFVDRPGNVFLAIQNETTWILPACERSNIPSEATHSIRTDAPGRAILRSGEWEVVEKAKITYW